MLKMRRRDIVCEVRTWTKRFINCDDNIVCDKIGRIIISDRHDVYISLQNSDDESYELSDIGKFLFYTREEAEKALAERGYK